MTCHLHFPSFCAINDFISHFEIVLWNLKWYFFLKYFLSFGICFLYFISTQINFTLLTRAFFPPCRTLLLLQTNHFLKMILLCSFFSLLRTAAVKRNVLSQSAFVENLLSFLQRKFLFSLYQFLHSFHPYFYYTRKNRDIHPQWNILQFIRKEEKLKTEPFSFVKQVFLFIRKFTIYTKFHFM